MCIRDRRNVKAGRLHFTTSLESCLDNVDIVFSAVGTPPDEDGSADLRYVLEVAKTIGANMKKYTLVAVSYTHLCFHNGIYMPKRRIFPSDLSTISQTPCPSAFRLKDMHCEMFQPKNILQENQFPKNRKNTNPAEGFQSPAEEFPSPILQPEYRWAGHLRAG